LFGNRGKLFISSFQSSSVILFWKSCVVFFNCAQGRHRKKRRGDIMKASSSLPHCLFLFGQAKSFHFWQDCIVKSENSLLYVNDDSKVCCIILSSKTSYTEHQTVNSANTCFLGFFDPPFLSTPTLLHRTNGGM